MDFVNGCKTLRKISYANAQTLLFTIHILQSTLNRLMLRCSDFTFTCIGGFVLLHIWI